MIRTALVLALLSGPLFAAPEASLRPNARVGFAIVADPSGSIVPPPRSTPGALAVQRGTAISRSLRPFLRSSKVEQVAKSRLALLAKGSVCGELGIQGKAVGSVNPKSQGCGVDDAVQVQSVAGVRLSQAAVIDCVTAKALKTWIEDTAKPTFAPQGGLRSLRVAAHYVCRTRNNQAGAKVSEHGRGRAIDIAGFQLNNGLEISVLNGWTAPASRTPLRRLHDGACGPFGTVLGPNADRFHQDHFHFDTARNRNGSYCR